MLCRDSQVIQLGNWLLLVIDGGKSVVYVGQAPEGGRVEEELRPIFTLQVCDGVQV